MSDREGYAYPDRVRREIPEQDRDAYLRSAEFVNSEGYDVLSVQHEYGIFGGEAGAHLMALVREAKMPIVTTLHTVLRDPTPAQKEVMDELLQLSERVVVMSQRAVGFLAEVHQVPKAKVDLIPHGIPEISDAKGRAFRTTLGITGPMILTFGLLSPDKGIQYVIEAMPSIVREYPGAVYFVVGATHPNVQASAGEVYRESLIALAERLGVSETVRFVDRFVSNEELVAYLGAMDYYVTPYLNPKQITSGTLAYSVGAGKVVISTPYWYAEELLSEGRGILVPFRDSAAISDSVLALQINGEERNEMGRRAAEFGSKMHWPEVARRYVASFSRAKHDSAERLRTIIHQSEKPTVPIGPLPKMRLNHLFELSDDTGILQHANHTIPNRAEGYCVDDNARALILTALLEQAMPLSPDLSLLQSRYLSFMLDAYNPETGRFRNFMSFRREWLEESGSEDSHGRSLWGLGVMVGRTNNDGRREVARALYLQGAPAMYATTSPRTWAYGVLAAHEFLQVFPHEYSIQVLLQTMASRLWRQYEINQSIEWPWFEQSLTYANARLSQAMIVAGESLGRQEMMDIGMESLRWLMHVQTGPRNVFAPIGTNGFYLRDAERHFFDQQPVEAHASLSACLTAARISGDSRWTEEAHRAFRWFQGENMLLQPVFDLANGGCHDGIHPGRINRNQGAESTLSWLCSLAELKGSTTTNLPVVA